MAQPSREVFAAIGEAVRALDAAVVHQLATRIEALPTGGGSWEALLGVVEHLSPPAARSAARRVVDAWQAPGGDLPPLALAAALRAAEQVDAFHRSRSTTELVWTGPTPSGTYLRRTDQALLETVAAARERLLIVSFVVHGAAAMRTAVGAALDRGVRVQLVLESAEESRGRVDGGVASWLAGDLMARVERYVWPHEAREKVPTASGAQRFGLLHAKCAVADDEVLFISSANLTDHAMALNMELGVLVRGGRQPGEVAEHFERLMEEGVLVRE